MSSLWGVLDRKIKLWNSKETGHKSDSNEGRRFVPFRRSVAASSLHSNTVSSRRTNDVSSSDTSELVRSCGWTAEHQVYPDLEQNLFDVVGSLGNGSLGVVEEVRVSSTHSSFVRKRVLLPYHCRKERLKIMKEEAEALRSLDHVHIVKIIGSYQDGPSAGRQFYSLLMFPVGDQDLKVYLDKLGEEMADGSMTPQKIEHAKLIVKKWFKCLASALDYMHGQGIRHQDIKPSNIIHRGTEVYFTDFSSSGRFDVGRTTSTDNPGRTSAMYAAPEVINSDGSFLRHGRGTDVFALGAVFCEMLAIVIGSTVHDFHDFLFRKETPDKTRVSPSSGGLFLYGRTISRIDEYFSGHSFYVECVKSMLAYDRTHRPGASSVASTMESHSHWPPVSCSCDSLRHRNRRLNRTDSAPEDESQHERSRNTHYNSSGSTGVVPTPSDTQEVAAERAARRSEQDHRSGNSSVGGLSGDERWRRVEQNEIEFYQAMREQENTIVPTPSSPDELVSMSTLLSHRNILLHNPMDSLRPPPPPPIKSITSPAYITRVSPGEIYGSVYEYGPSYVGSSAESNRRRRRAERAKMERETREKSNAKALTAQRKKEEEEEKEEEQRKLSEKRRAIMARRNEEREKEEEEEGQRNLAEKARAIMARRKEEREKEEEEAEEDRKRLEKAEAEIDVELAQWAEEGLIGRRNAETEEFIEVDLSPRSQQPVTASSLPLPDSLPMPVPSLPPSATQTESTLMNSAKSFQSREENNRRRRRAERARMEMEARERRSNRVDFT
jgi:serine/threonine protein kinase